MVCNSWASFAYFQLFCNHTNAPLPVYVMFWLSEQLQCDSVSERGVQVIRETCVLTINMYIQTMKKEKRERETHIHREFSFDSAQ